MTTDTAAAADAVEAAADAAEAAAQAAEAAADAAGDVADAAGESDGESDAPAAPANPEGAHDDAVQLDHEQRITRLEDAVAVAVAAIGERPTHEEVRAMTPDVSEVVETAAAVATSAADAAVDEHEHDDHDHDGDGDGDEGAGETVAEETIIEPTEPDSPEVNDESEPRARGFRW